MEQAFLVMKKSQSKLAAVEQASGVEERGCRLRSRDTVPTELMHLVDDDSLEVGRESIIGVASCPASPVQYVSI